MKILGGLFLGVSLALFLSAAPARALRAPFDGAGNDILDREHFDIYSGESSGPPKRHAHAEESREDWVSDEMASRSAAPRAAARYGRGETIFAFYGDIPTLKGLQLEVSLNRLHHIHQKEIDLAGLAATRAKSAEVLELARRIKADHEALDARVKALAVRRGCKLERFQLATYEKTVRTRLAKLKGEEFEAAFLRVNDRGAEESASVMRMVRSDVGDPEARDLISEAIPKIMALRAVSKEKSRAKARAEDGQLGQ